MALEKGVSFKLPANTKQISKDDLDANTKSHQAADKFFVYKGVFVALNINTDSRLENMTLERHLAILKYDWKNLVKIELLEIRTINNKRFVVMDHYNPRKQLNEYTFFNDHERNSIVVDGTIQYNKATQKKEADKLLETVLTGLKVK
ncbi:MAG: hypothetical protein H7Y07_15125 [Pyrinomonadaceae bacterium]|nr:hypothetical protein [Sphingobacteriaceae bacterium]